MGSKYETGNHDVSNMHSKKGFSIQDYEMSCISRCQSEFPSASEECVISHVATCNVTVGLLRLELHR